VAPDSSPLNKIRMISPFREIVDLDDISQTCWQDNYVFQNKGYSSGGYQIIQCGIFKEYAIINYDYFDNLYVYSTNRIASFETSKSPMCRIIAIDFREHPIIAGSYRLVRITFRITSVVDEIFPRVYSLKLAYFNQSLISEQEIQDIKMLEIPVRKLIDEETKKGGFDVILYLPPNLSTRHFNAYRSSVGNELPNGTLSEKKGEKLFWRGRAFLPESEEYITSGNVDFIVEGLIGDPYELQEIRGEISQLKEDSNNLKKDTETLKEDTGILKILSRRGKRIAIFAVTLAALALISSNYERISIFIKASMQAYKELSIHPKGSNPSPKE